jgi:hypothetical protein
MTEHEIYKRLAMHALDLYDRADAPEAKAVATSLSKKWLAKAREAKLAVACDPARVG